MKKYFALLLFFTGFTQGLLADGSQESPWIIDCSDCYSDLDYKQFAKLQIGTNQSGYFLITNDSAGIVKTVYAFNIYEREVGIDRTGAFITSTAPEHLNAYEEHLDWLATVSPDLSISIYYPAEGNNGFSGCCFLNDPGAMLDYGTFIRGNLPTNIFSTRKLIGEIVKLEFPNGDTLYYLIMNLTSSIAGQIVMVTDEHGNFIYQFGQSSGSNSGNSGGNTGGSSWGNTIWTISSTDISWSCTFDGRTLTCSKD